ncbi:hypothetical protein FRB90_007975 [Tulasnella sp. 427]|nr:hypothetical protein FRB90_007975 [Tulasnella sp. 427]
MKQQPNLNVLDIPAVEEYLRQNLYWIPRNDAGKLGRPEDVPSLEVTVIDTPLTAHEDEDFPVVGTLRKHNEVTFDQPGGRVRDLSRA